MKSPIIKSAKMAATAYQGDAMTLLAFDLLNKGDRKDFVGFTIEIKNETMPAFKALNNRISFDAPPANLTDAEKSKLRFSSAVAPFQKFRWIHVLRNFAKTNEQPFFGEYQYRITPRYFKNGKLEAVDAANPADSVTLTIDVKPFKKDGIEVAFTRGFLVSQAYIDRFGLNSNIRPVTSDVVFNPETTQNDIFSDPTKKKLAATLTPYTYEEQYAWMGFYARQAIMGFIDEVIQDPDKSIDVLAYDFSEPDIASNFLTLAKKGRIRMFLDDHDVADAVDNGGKKSDPEYKKQFADEFDTTHGATLTRHHFSGLAHCKIFIQRNKAGQAIKVLTGSTNFTANGIYINANHILIFTQPEMLKLYDNLFLESIKPDAKKNFKSRPPATSKMVKIVNNPLISVSLSPHTSQDASDILEIVNGRINGATASVFFAVMELKSSGSVTATLRKIHEREDIFTLGITDLQKESADLQVRLYEPRSKKGVLINGKKSPKLMPPPFNKEVSMGLGHEVHHKFVVVDFNTPKAVVFCGSSNLAQGGEEGNGDNLIMIEDADIATVFAIEAIRLIDHYQFRNRQSDSNSKDPLVLKADNKWYEKYFDENDLYFLDKTIFLGN